MLARDPEKLLGGYATGTLTEEERRALFEAALHDQELFNALGDEQALKELLDDPVSRQRLLQALEKASAQPAAAWLTAVVEWFRRPANLGLAGSLATAIIAIVVVTNVQREQAFQSVDEVMTADSDRLEQAKPEPVQPSEEDAVATKHLPVHDEVSKVRKENKQPTAAAGKTRTDQAFPARRSAALEPESQPALPPPQKAKQERAKRQSRSIKSVQPRTPVPAPPELFAEEDAKEAAGAKASRLEDATAKLRRAGDSTTERATQGPARELFYKGARQRAPRAGRGGREAQTHKDERRDQAKEEMAEFGAMGQRAAPSGPSATIPLGLRYSILKQAEDGTFRETSPEGPFGADDVLRLTIEVNAPGYLYVFREGQPGEGTWLFPAIASPTPGGFASARVVSRRRYVIPVTGSLGLSPASPKSKTILVFSREPRPDLHALSDMTARDKPRADQLATDLEVLQNRLGAEANSKPYLIEEVKAGQPGSPSEQAVYLVSTNPAPNALILAEVELPRD